MKNPSLKDIEVQAAARPTPAASLEFLQETLKDDPRQAAKNLVLKYRKRVEKDGKEAERLSALWEYERKAWAKGAKAVAGLDEAGRGPLVGPVVAAAVVFPAELSLPGLDDSKKLTPEVRERLHDVIHREAVMVGVGQASAREIDEQNIYRASILAMERAVEALPNRPDHLLIDAMRLDSHRNIPQDRIIHGDALSASVAAASIIAKVTRDRMLLDLAKSYPMYGFDRHKGYGTAEHMEALRLHGPCPEHRKTFGPVAGILGGVPPDAKVGYWEAEIGKAKDPEALAEVGRMIKAVGRKKLQAEEVQRLRDLYRKRRNQLQ